MPLTGLATFAHSTPITTTCCRNIIHWGWAKTSITNNQCNMLEKTTIDNFIQSKMTQIMQIQIRSQWTIFDSYISDICNTVKHITVEVKIVPPWSG